MYLLILFEHIIEPAFKRASKSSNKSFPGACKESPPPRAAPVCSGPAAPRESIPCSRRQSVPAAPGASTRTCHTQGSRGDCSLPHPALGGRPINLVTSHPWYCHFSPPVSSYRQGRQNAYFNKPGALSVAGPCVSISLQYRWQKDLKIIGASSSSMELDWSN